jgi:hypothetical protein
LRARGASFETALFFFGQAARFLGAAAIGFLDSFLLELAALLIGASGVDRDLARLEFGFREVGLLQRFPGGAERRRLFNRLLR